MKCTIGEPFAVLETEGGDEDMEPTKKATPVSDQAKVIEQEVTETIERTTSPITNSGERFYSPLVRSMASEEGINMSELESIPGTGKDGRVTKTDMINFLKNRGEESNDTPVKVEETKQSDNLKSTKSPNQSSTPIPNTGEVEIVEMDRMRKLISAHMTMSKATSAHITSMVEVDMTNIVNWRNTVKTDFKKKDKYHLHSYYYKQ